MRVGVAVGVTFGKIVALGVTLGIVVGLSVGELVGVGVSVGVQVDSITTGKNRVLTFPGSTVQEVGFSPATRASPIGNHKVVLHWPGANSWKPKCPLALVVA